MIFEDRGMLKMKERRLQAYLLYVMKGGVNRRAGCTVNEELSA